MRACASYGALGIRADHAARLVAVALLFAVASPSADAAEARKGKVQGGILTDQEDFYAVDVIDRDHVWIVGSYGTAIVLLGEMRLAELRPAPIREPLFCVSFRDASNGLVGARLGKILRTTDAGRSWSTLSLPDVKENILAIARGHDPDRVWAVGPQGTVVHSADDGKTWKNLSLGKDITLNGVTFVDDQEGWLVGEFGTILHTVDGGKTWERSGEIQGLPPYVEDVSAEDALRMGVPPLTADDLYLLDVLFVSPDVGYISAAGGFVLHTTDRGRHWTASRAATRNTLFKLAQSPGGSLVATGVLGTLVRQEDGRWVRDEDLSHRLFTWLRDVQFSPDGGL